MSKVPLFNACGVWGWVDDSITQGALRDPGLWSITASRVRRGWLRDGTVGKPPRNIASSTKIPRLGRQLLHPVREVLQSGGDYVDHPALAL